MKFRNAVDSILPGGGSNLKSALQLAYKEVLSNYRKGYVNQVLFLTDGVGDKKEIFRMANTYQALGIHVTAIGMGEDCDLSFIDNLADRAGGSSRFLANRETIEEMFGRDFSRMVVPIARNVELELYLTQNLEDFRIWGYHAQIEGQWESYRQQKESKPPDPQGIAIDSLGNAYITDAANNRVQKFGKSGNLITQWGRTGSGDGQFSYPGGVTVDRYRNVYVADAGNSRLQIFESDGNFITSLTSKGAGKETIRPNGVAMDSNGKFFIADMHHKLIKKYNIEKSFVSQWGSYGIEDRAFANLSAIAVDSGGNVYATEADKNSIQQFDGAGRYMIKQPIRDSLPAVNLGDYETIVIQARIPRQETEGNRTIARLHISYTDMDDNRIEMEHVELKVNFVSKKNPVDGISNALVLRASTILHYAQSLKQIGTEYHAGRVRRALDLTNEIKKELLNTRDRLGESLFEKELNVLEKYITVMGDEAHLDKNQTRLLLQDREITPVSADRGLLDHLNNLFQEITLDLQARRAGNLALLGFSFPDDRRAKLLDLLEETAGSALFDLSQFTVLERRRIDAVLKEQELSVTDLMDTDKVIEMNKSVVIFFRVINTETAAIESVSQVILPRNAEVNALL